MSRRRVIRHDGALRDLVGITDFIPDPPAEVWAASIRRQASQVVGLWQKLANSNYVECAKMIEGIDKIMQSAQELMQVSGTDLLQTVVEQSGQMKETLVGVLQDMTQLDAVEQSFDQQPGTGPMTNGQPVMPTEGDPVMPTARRKIGGWDQQPRPEIVEATMQALAQGERPLEEVGGELQERGWPVEDVEKAFDEGLEKGLWDISKKGMDLWLSLRPQVSTGKLAQEQARGPTDDLPGTWLWTRQGPDLYGARDSRWEPSVPDLISTSREDVILQAQEQDQGGAYYGSAGKMGTKTAFEESQHPRGEGGEFTSGGEGGDSGEDSGPLSEGQPMTPAGGPQEAKSDYYGLIENGIDQDTAFQTVLQDNPQMNPEELRSAIEGEGGETPAEPAAETSPAVQEFKQTMEMMSSGDEWGDTMNAWFNIADYMSSEGMDIPGDWEYSPGAMGAAPPEDIELWELEGKSQEELAEIGTWLSEESNRLKAEGKDY